jgi:hypothetical protein
MTRVWHIAAGTRGTSQQVLGQEGDRIVQRFVPRERACLRREGAKLDEPDGSIEQNRKERREVCDRDGLLHDGDPWRIIVEVHLAEVLLRAACA